MKPDPSRDGTRKTDEGTRRILVVDDDLNLARLLRTILRTAGYEVASSTDGFQALDMLAREHFDAVVLDLRMPRIDGRTLFRQLRGSGNQVPVLIASAYGARSAQIELGAEGSIEKPFDPESLLEAVEQLLAAARTSSE